MFMYSQLQSLSKSGGYSQVPPAAHGSPLPPVGQSYCDGFCDGFCDGVKKVGDVVAGIGRIACLAAKIVK